MDINKSGINFDSPHVVFIGAEGKIFFAEKSKGIHNGLQVIAEFPDFYQASVYVKFKEEVNGNKTVVTQTYSEAKEEKNDI